VRPGELVGLLGPSGCGKTTTLRVVAGFEQPDAGDILVRGQPIAHLPPYRRNMGIVFQSYALFPHMTVLQNVAYGLRVRGLARPEQVRRAARALELVQLSGLEGRYPRQLSGGQQQRAALARAIVIEPALLLLDEPFSNLDAKLRHEMRGELRQLQRRLQIATIFVTHDQEEALALADRVAVMSHGQVEQVGTPEEIYSRPRTRFVAGFIGECNFLPGVVAAVGSDAVTFRSGGLVVRVAVPSPGPPAGAAGTLAVRPEVIRVLPAGGAPPAGTNAASGTVRETVYLGASRRYAVSLAGGPEILVHEQNVGTPAWPVGQAVVVAWDPGQGSLQLDDRPG
jgi:ABC-type Fe3+/spermidine/putrescine transport system ATPase subunit